MLPEILSLPTVLIFVGISLAAPAPAPKPKSIWGIDIWREPAPLPEDGPPASAAALRDPGKLKYEVVGIVFAYIAWVLLTIFAIVVVTRRTQQRQQSFRNALRMQMFKPSKITTHEVEVGPRSPGGMMSPKSPMASLKSWAKGQNKTKTSESSYSPVTATVDERVVDEDKNRNMDEMAKLYAAVMAHDEERGSNKGHSAGSSPIIDDNSPITPRSPSYPPEMAHPAYNPPTSPRMYQGTSYEPMPPPPISMENDEQQLLNGEPAPRKSKNAALSIISSTTSILSSNSKNRPAPITVRGQAISNPIGSADLQRSAVPPSATTIASSVYTPGPPPPTPGKTPTAAVEEFEMHGRPQLTSLASDSSQSPPKVLPFRQYQDSLKSAPPTKTTFLDRRTSALNGPKTGVPKTPYSPYCPTTPMTPVTPRRLPTKDELKKNKKQYALKSVRENDLVQSDNDMWGTE